MPAFAEQEKVPLSTLSWLNRRGGKDLNIAAFAPRKPGPKKAPVIDQRVLTWAISWWKRHPHAPFITIYRNAQKASRRMKWYCPSYKALKREIQKIPGAYRVFVRSGVRGHFEGCALVRRKEPLLINTICQVDHSWIPVFAVNPTGGEDFRPILMTAIDGTSRVIKAWSLHSQEPTTEDALALLRQSIPPKKDQRSPF